MSVIDKKNKFIDSSTISINQLVAQRPEEEWLPPAVVGATRVGR